MAALAVAVAPIAVTHDVMRLGSGLLVLVGSATLMLAALAGTPEPLTAIAAGIAMVALAAAVAVVAGGAMAATGGTVIPDDVPGHRAAATRAGGELP
jgi:hypothetical protein